MYCYKCGKETVAGAPFCRFCGQAAAPTQPTACATAVTPSAQIKPRKSHKVRNILLSLLGVLVVLCVVAALIPNSPSTTNRSSPATTSQPAATGDAPSPEARESFARVLTQVYSKVYRDADKQELAAGGDPRYSHSYFRAGARQNVEMRDGGRANLLLIESNAIGDVQGFLQNDSVWVPQAYALGFSGILIYESIVEAVFQGASPVESCSFTILDKTTLRPDGCEHRMWQRGYTFKVTADQIQLKLPYVPPLATSSAPLERQAMGEKECGPGIADRGCTWKYCLPDGTHCIRSSRPDYCGDKDKPQPEACLADVKYYPRCVESPTSGCARWGNSIAPW